MRHTVSNQYETRQLPYVDSLCMFCVAEAKKNRWKVRDLVAGDYVWHIRLDWAEPVKTLCNRFGGANPTDLLMTPSDDGDYEADASGYEGLS